MDTHLLLETVQNTMRTLAEKLADKYIEDHGQEILGKIQQNAVVTLALAGAASRTAEQLVPRR